MEKTEVFEYNYSAKQQEEVDAIKRKYLPKEKNAKELGKLEELRQLDKKVESIASIWSIVVGVIGILVFGTGMSLIMAFETAMYVPGILAGILGLIDIVLAMPVYRYVLKRQREKVAPRVLALTEELSQS